VKNLSAST